MERMKAMTLRAAKRQRDEEAEGLTMRPINPSSLRQSARMSSSKSVALSLPRPAFTMTEMLIVIGIIIMVSLIAIPALRVMQGGRSIDAATNQLSALVDRARAQALATNRPAGILFFIDPSSQRVGAIIVEQPRDVVTTTLDYQLDKSDTDSLLLPSGVGLQVIDAKNGRYVGYNPLFVNGQPLQAFEQPGSNVGGILLFDGDGKLASRNAVLFMKTVTTPVTNTAIARFVYADDNVTPPGQFGAPNTTGTASDVFFHPALGVILFDQEGFLAAGGDNTDPQIADAQETTEERWLHENGVPVLVNRYSGAILRGE